MKRNAPKPTRGNGPGRAEGTPLSAGLDYGTVFNATSNGMAFTEFSSGRMLDVNAAWIRATGIVREKAIGRAAFELGLWADLAEREACLAELERKGRLVDFEARLIMQSAELPHLMSAQFVEMGGKRCVLWELRDIAAQKRTHEALIKGEAQVKSLLAVSEHSRRVLLGILQDEKLAREALRESEEHFRRAVLDSPFPVLLHAEDGAILQVSNSWCEITGYTREELATIADWTKRAYGERKTLVQADIDALYRLDHRKYEGDSTLRTKSGETRIWEFSSAPLGRLPDGRRLVISMAMDVTERRRAEAALQESAQLLRDTGEMAKVGGWELDLATQEVSWTEEVGRIHGVEPGYKPKLEEAIKFYAPESRPDVEAVVKKAAETGEPYDLESLFIPRGSKDKIWVRSLGRAVYSGGKIVKLTGTFQNIDKYKRAEEALRESEERYRALAEGANEAIITIDEHGKIVFFNRAAEPTYGYSADEVLGKVFIFLVPERLRERQWERANHAFSIGDSDAIRKILGGIGLKKDGSEFPVEFSLAKWKINNDLFFSIILRDITERKKANDKIMEYTSKLEVQKLTLEQKNLALTEMIEHIERAKNKIKEDIAINVNETVLPILEKLKIKGASSKYIDLLHRHLEELVSSYGRKLTQKSTKLTYREIEICNMIKSGVTTKEVSDLLNVSPQTIERHRKNIRKKLAISNKKVNLTSYLQSL